MLISNDINNKNQMLSSTSNIPLRSIEQMSTHSIIGTNTTGTSSSEPLTWNEEDALMLQCSTSSNDDDDEHEIISNDNEESHIRRQMIPGPPTIIYV
jgi:hypothetical protein